MRGPLVSAADSLGEPVEVRQACETKATKDLCLLHVWGKSNTLLSQGMCGCRTGII